MKGTILFQSARKACSCYTEVKNTEMWLDYRGHWGNSHQCTCCHFAIIPSELLMWGGLHCCEYVRLVSWWKLFPRSQPSTKWWGGVWRGKTGSNSIKNSLLWARDLQGGNPTKGVNYLFAISNLTKPPPPTPRTRWWSLVQHSPKNTGNIFLG